MASTVQTSSGPDRGTFSWADQVGRTSQLGEGFEPTLRLSDDSSLELLDDGALLFVERGQELHRLEGSSALLAANLRDGATVGALENTLAAMGVAPPIAAGWTRQFLLQFARLGVLAADLPEQASDAELSLLRINGIGIGLTFGSPELRKFLGSPFAHLVAQGPAEEGYVVRHWGDFALIRPGEGPAHVVERPLAAIRLKGMILERILASADHLTALHAACAVRNGRALLLLGSPGAGKTTMTLAALGQGYRYAADDVTLLHANGQVTGVPLAPSVKESAWPIVEAVHPGMLQEEVHCRPDGQWVRFAGVGPDFVSAPVHVAAVVRLKRSESRATELLRVPREAALASLIGEGKSRDGRCSGETMQALVALVRGADCFDLHYAAAREAAPLLTSLTAND